MEQIGASRLQPPTHLKYLKFFENLFFNKS